MTFSDAAAREFPPFSTDACIKCNVCTTVCPVSRVTDAFPGPKYVGPQAQRFRGPSAHGSSPDRTVDLCSGCGICTRACPAGVLIAETNNRARATIVAERGSSIRNRLISDTDLLIRLGANPLAPLANFGLRNRFARWVGEKALGVHRRGPLAPFSRRTFRAWWRGADRPVDLPTTADPERTVVYFHGCAVNGFEPDLGRDAVAILERNGFSVIVPAQECCGLPFISNGMYDHARRKARRNLDSLAAFARAGYRIVGTSTSCTHALKAEYREMLDLADDDARAVADATWDICELLLDLHDRGELDTALRRRWPSRCRTTRRASCARTGSGRRRWTSSGSSRACAPPTRTTTAAARRERTGSRPSAGRSPRTLARPSSTRSVRPRRPARRAPPVTRRRAAGRSSSPRASRRSTRSRSWPRPTAVPTTLARSPGAGSSERPAPAAYLMSLCSMRRIASQMQTAKKTSR